MPELMGVGSLVGWDDLTTLLARLALDLAFVSIVIQLVYFRLYQNREHVFTCHLFNLVTLCLCLMLRKGPAELGFGLTLFGVFGILRYRTEQIRSRDLTYLFIVIGMALINAVANKKVSAAELLLVDSVICGMVALLELPRSVRNHGATPMIYDNLALLKPGKEQALINDLSERTGMTVMRVEVHTIDFLRDAAEITVVYLRPDQGTHAK